MLMFGLSAQIDSDVHEEDGRQIPKRPIKRFTESVLMFEKKGAKDGAHGLEEIWHTTIEHVELNQPIGIDDSIIEEIGQDEAMPVFLPVRLVATMIFLQITGNKEENGNDISL